MKNKELKYILIAMGVIALLFVNVSIVKKIINRNDNTETQNMYQQANKEFISNMENKLKLDVGIPKGIHFKSITASGLSVTINYSVNKDELENKDFLYDLITTASSVTLNTIGENYSKISMNEFILQFDKFATVKVHKYDFVDNQITNDIIQKNLHSANGEYENNIAKENEEKNKQIVSTCDNMVSSMKTYIEKIGDTANTGDYNALFSLIASAEDYRNTVTIKLNNYQENDPTNKVNAAYNVLTNYDKVLRKINKILDKGKDGFVTLETTVSEFDKSISVYNNTK